MLVGGLTSTIEVWGMQRSALAERFRLILPDNRGSGRTRVPRDTGARSMKGFADDVRVLLDGLDLDRVHLVGASMGGMIAQTFALAYPDRVRSLVLACTSFGGPQAVAAAPDVVAKLLSSSGDGADASISVVAHPSSPTERPAAVAFYLEGKHAYPHSPEEIMRRAQAIVAFDVADEVKAITAPTLVITGAQDQIVPPENAKRLVARIPNVELVEIDQAGHIFFCEQAEQTNAAIAQFLSRHAAGTAPV